MPEKNILVANHHLHKPGGTETYTYSIIEELVGRGHQVEYFTFCRGEIAGRIEDNFGVSYMRRRRYDLILASHNTCVDYLFNKGFLMQTCHGIFPELEQPSPNADAYVTISAEVRDHLKKSGYGSKVILNGINLERYNSIIPVKESLRCVLSLCHSEAAHNLLRTACDKIGAKLLVLDKYKNPVWRVAQVINEADLVVGVGRSAYEAMACGRPVIVFDHREYYPACGDGYVKDIIERSIYNNCSGRFSNKHFTAEDIETEFAKYTASDSLFFRKYAEKNFNIKIAVDRYLNYYYEFKKKSRFSVAQLKANRLNSKIKPGLEQYFIEPG